MIEAIPIEELGLHACALKIPQVPEGWSELVPSWKPNGQDVWIQIADAVAVAGMPHILISIFNVASAFRNGYNILDRLEAELLLVLSGTDRFQRALEIVGAKAGQPGIAIVLARERDACVSAAEGISASLGGIEVPDLAPEGSMAQGLGALGFLSSGRQGDGLQAFLYALIERGALLYCK